MIKYLSRNYLSGLLFMYEELMCLSDLVLKCLSFVNYLNATMLKWLNMYVLLFLSLIALVFSLRFTFKISKLLFWLVSLGVEGGGVVVFFLQLIN